MGLLFDRPQVQAPPRLPQLPEIQAPKVQLLPVDPGANKRRGRKLLRAPVLPNKTTTSGLGVKNG
jgi:hypothetical protein